MVYNSQDYVTVYVTTWWWRSLEDDLDTEYQGICWEINQVILCLSLN
jgi:hypothetical protein